MSVLIRGMEMPTSCEDCPMCHSNAEYDYAYCCVSSAETSGKKIPSDCPLVPVPPHGRLIDADALIDKVIAKYLKFEREGKLVFAAAEIKQDICDLISDAPTIIPAEEGE